MADRFQGTSPDQYMQMDIGRREKIIQVMSVEGEIKNLFAEAKEDLEPGDDIWIAKVEYDLWDDD